MGKETAISWADATVNFWHGCKKVSKGCKFCVDPSTLILMADYTQKPISEIIKGDRIFSIEEFSKNQNRKFVEAQVEDIGYIEKESYEITTNSGSIICSTDHPFLVRDKRSWVEPINFKVGRTKLSKLELPYNESEYTKPYMMGYIAGITNGDGTFRYDENWGSVHKKESEACYWRVAVCDQEIIDRIILFMNRLFQVKLESKIFYKGTDVHLPLNKVESRSQKILKLILTCLDYNLNKYDSDFHRGYLGGMFDAEGNMSKYSSKKRIRVNSLRIAQSKNPEYIERIRFSLISLGFDFNLSKIGFTLSGGSVGKIRFFSYTTPAVLRKTDLFNVGSTHNQDLITNIKYLGKRVLIDIQTSSKTFIANSFITHNCYMYREKSRFGQKGDIVTRSSKQKFFEALRWQDGKLIFTCSWSDFFIKNADEIKDADGNIISHWRKEAWEVIKNTPQHTWIILTKRPERILQCLPPDWGPKGYPNVWLGVSVESQKTAHNRIMELFKVRCAVRVVSAEPLLEKIDLTPYLKVQLGPKEWVYPIHWVIAGGESGNNEGEFKYRPCRPEWLHDIVKQCKAQEVPVFIKQLGTSISKQMELKDRHGADLSEPAFPGYLKLQEFPKILTI